MRMLYLVDDSVSNWSFLGVNILEIKGDVQSARDIDIDNRDADVRLAMARSFKKYKEMKDLLGAQRTLLEAANASPYGWHVARYMDKNQNIFSENDSENMEELRKVEGFVRRDQKEFKAQRGASSNRGRGKRGGWTRWNNAPKSTANQLAQAIMSMQVARGTGRGG